MSRSVRIRVPGTSANLGPGFDSLGCAFSVYNYLTFCEAEKTEIEGCPPEFSGEDNLALVAFRAAEKRAGRPACHVKIQVQTHVPSAGGLGSSATLLAGGAMGANALLGLGLDRKTLLDLVTELEGHPDNAAPALYGGLTASMMDNGHPVTVSLPLHESYRFCAFTPECHTDTRAARRVLPTSVPHRDAVYNVSHALLLGAAFASGDTELLTLALHDRLHEPYRRSLIEGYDAVEEAALSRGAHAFFLSGSGSTLMAVYTDPEFPERVLPQISAMPHRWTVLPLLPDRDGACVL